MNTFTLEGLLGGLKLKQSKKDAAMKFGILKVVTLGDGDASAIEVAIFDELLLAKAKVMAEGKGTKGIRITGRIEQQGFDTKLVPATLEVVKLSL